MFLANHLKLSEQTIASIYQERPKIGVSRKWHIIKKIKVRPVPRDYSPVNREAPLRKIKKVKLSDKEHLLWGIFVHVAKIETRREVNRLSRKNGGVPGNDSLSFDDTEVRRYRGFFLENIRQNLLSAM